MIIDHLTRYRYYLHVAPQLQSGFDFLQRPDLNSLPDGRHDIAGDELFAIVARGQGRGRAAAPLEYHRRYIDIQYVVAGEDDIGWLATDACQLVREPYQSSNDIGFFNDMPQAWLRLQPGYFTIFLPSDAHAPLAGTESVHKVVIKVAVK